MRFRSRLLLLFITLLLSGACAGEKEPAKPRKTFELYTKAIKQKDTETMKLLLSKQTIQMHELEAQAQGISVDEIVKRETLFAPHQTSVKLKNEKIEGDSATLEVENSAGKWEIVPFVKEDGEWKIDKKGFAQRMMDKHDKDNQVLDDLHNQGLPPQP